MSICGGKGKDWRRFLPSVSIWADIKVGGVRERRFGNRHVGWDRFRGFRTHVACGAGDMGRGGRCVSRILDGMELEEV
jgi:hypothetical protein